MNIVFAGFRHSHIIGLYKTAVESTDINIIGYFERDELTRKNIKEKLDIKFNYNSYEEILADKNVDAIAIGDYYSIRGSMIISALKAGKHVICDKPLCTDLKELDEIEKLSSEKNLEVCCMLDLRYMPQVSKVKEMIEKGEIGTVHNVTFTGQHHLDYGNRPSWYFEKEKHGGTINDIAIHGIDLVRFITGKNLTKINCAKVWNAFADKEPEFKDCGQLMVEMDNISLTADVSYAAPKCGGLPTYWDFYFWGNKGMINFRYFEEYIHLYKDTETIIECKRSSPDYLNDFVKEINDIDTIMKTKDIFSSQRQTLMIQNYADNNNHNLTKS